MNPAPTHSPPALCLRALIKQWVGMFLLWPFEFKVAVIGVQLCLVVVTLYVAAKGWREGLRVAPLRWQLFTYAMMALNLAAMWTTVGADFGEG